MIHQRSLIFYRIFFEKKVNSKSLLGFLFKTIYTKQLSFILFSRDPSLQKTRLSTCDIPLKQTRSKTQMWRHFRSAIWLFWGTITLNSLGFATGIDNTWKPLQYDKHVRLYDLLCTIDVCKKYTPWWKLRENRCKTNQTCSIWILSRLIWLSKLKKESWLRAK